MSDRIQELLDGIREKATAWHQQYTEERNANQNLRVENSELKAKLEATEQELEAMKQRISGLEMKLEMAKNTDVIVSQDTGVSDEQIDELVKEIEYCIAQLKK